MTPLRHSWARPICGAYHQGASNSPARSWPPSCLSSSERTFRRIRSKVSGVWFSTGIWQIMAKSANVSFFWEGLNASEPGALSNACWQVVRPSGSSKIRNPEVAIENRTLHTVFLPALMAYCLLLETLDFPVLSLRAFLVGTRSSSERKLSESEAYSPPIQWQCQIRQSVCTWRVRWPIWDSRDWVQWPVAFSSARRDCTSTCSDFNLAILWRTAWNRSRDVVRNSPPLSTPSLFPRCSPTTGASDQIQQVRVRHARW